MPPYETQPSPFVALGAMPMRTLQNAYAAAIRRRAATIGTLDLLVQVAVYAKRTPPWLLAGSRAGLMRMAADPHRIPTGRALVEQAPGPVSEFDPEVRSTLREVEWCAHRTAGRLSPVERPMETSGTGDRGGPLVLKPCWPAR